MPTKKSDENVAVEKPRTESKKESSNEYIVKEGDTIASVATAHGLSVRMLAQKNRLRSLKIVPDQKLSV